MMTDRVGLILLLVLFHLFQYYETKLTFFVFLNSTRVGLIPSNYNYYFEMNDHNRLLTKDSRINPILRH